MKKEIMEKPPCREYETRAVEDWLEYQALQGKMVFDTAGRSFYFCQAEPGKRAFRLEPSDGKKSLDTSGREAWKRKGWEYAATYRKLYHIFWSDTEERDETEALAAEQAVGFAALNQRSAPWPLAWIAVELLYLGALWLHWKREGTFLQLLYSSGLAQILGCAAGLALVIFSLLCFRKIRGYGDMVKEKPLDGETYSRYMKRSGKMLMMFNGLWMATLVLMTAGGMMSRSSALPEQVLGQEAFLSAESLEGELYTPDLDHGKPIRQYIDRQLNPLVKENLSVEQSGYLFENAEDLEAYREASMSDEIQPKKKELLEAAAGKGTRIGLTFQYYRLRSADSAEELLDRVLSYYNRELQSQDAFEDGIYGFDRAYVLRLSSGKQAVCARSGEQAVFLTYEGDLDMRDCLERIFETIIERGEEWRSLL